VLRDQLRDVDGQEHLVLTLFRGAAGAAAPDLALDIPSGPLRRVLDPRAVRGLRRVIRRERIDLVVAHGGEPVKYAIPAAGRTPVIYYKVGLSSTEVSRPSRAMLYARLARRAAHVVGVSEAITDQVRELFGVPAERVSVIPNGRDPAVYHPSTEPRSASL
ncbi:MAG: glycosyltransferase, partial [Propionibacteriaceae bacterium]|nr:glycosyltransferase [Propionibacteriaceae bacterium]